MLETILQWLGLVDEPYDRYQYAYDHPFDEYYYRRRQQELLDAARARRIRLMQQGFVARTQDRLHKQTVARANYYRSLPGPLSYRNPLSPNYPLNIMRRHRR